MDKIVILGLIVLIGVAEVLWGAFVLTCLWGWFTVPLGAPAIGLAMAAGLGLLIQSLTFQVRDGDIESRDTGAQLYRAFSLGAYNAANLLVLLAVGFIVSFFV